MASLGKIAALAAISGTKRKSEATRAGKWQKYVRGGKTTGAPIKSSGAAVSSPSSVHAVAAIHRDQLVKQIRKQYPDEYKRNLKALQTTTIGGVKVPGLGTTRSQEQAALTSVLQTHRAEVAARRAEDNSLAGKVRNYPGVLGLVDKDARDVTTKFLYGSENPTLKQNLTTAAIGAIPIGGAAGLGGKALERLGGKALPKIAEKVAPAVEKAAPKAGRAASKLEKAKGAVGAPKRAVESVATKATKPVRTLAAKAPKPVRTAGKVTLGTGRVIKRNAGKTVFGAPFAAQAPLALKNHDPSEFQKALTGKGVFATGLHGAAKAVNEVLPGIAGNAVNDAISLPADILPSTYFGVHAAVEAAGGNSDEAKKLWSDYKKTGFLPPLVQGDFKGAAKAFEHHPVYSALEASGGYAGVGRGAGAIIRKAPFKEVRALASTKRPSKKVYGNVEKPQDYSANVITKAVQVAGEKRQARKGQDPFVATGKERRKYLDKATDDFEGAAEGRRRSLLQEAVNDVERKRPGRFRAIARGDKNVVAEVAEGKIRNRGTWADDIALRIKQLKSNEMRPGTMTRAEKKASRTQIAALEGAKRIEDPKRVDAIFEAADVYRQKMHARRGDLVEAGLLDKDQALKAAAIPYARTHMGAGYGMPKAAAKRYEELRAEMAGKVSPERFGQISKEMAELRATTQTLDHKGDPLPYSAIKASMDAHGVDPAYLTHRQGARGKGSFYQPWSSGRSGAAHKARTGSAVTKGSYDSTWDAMVEQVASATTKTNRAKTFDDFIGRFAVRPKGGYFRDMAEARDALHNPDRYGIDVGDTEMVPVRLTAPGSKGAETTAAKRRGDPAEMDRVLSPDADPSAVLSDMLAVAEKDVGNGPVVLVPKQVMDRFREHAKPAGTSMRTAQALNSAFKSTVLPISPRWVYGNMIEPFVRSAINGLTPVDYVAGKRLARHIKSTDPETFRDLEQRTLGGTLFGAADRQRIHRDASQFVDTNVAPLANAITAIGNAPVARNLTRMYRAYRDTVFALNSRLFEREPQFAALGKEARKQLQQTTDSWNKSLWLGEKALDDLGKGLKNTDAQLAYGDSVGKVFGNWYRLSPNERTAVMSYAPFYGWAKASGVFIFKTLPRDHPIKTAIAVALVRATEEERNAYGEGRGASKPLPPSLQGSLPGGIRAPGPKDGEIGQHGGIVPIMGLSSFGSWSNPVEAPGNFFVPEISGVLDALSGRDWKGDPLKDQYGRPVSESKRVLDAAGAFSEALLPPYALYQRIKQSDSVGDYFKPVRPIKASTTGWLRSLHNTQTIRVPLSKENRAKLRLQP